MLDKGYNVIYDKRLREIENIDFGIEFRENYKILFVLEYVYSCL